MVQGGKVFFFQFEIPLRGMEFSHLVICGGFNELVIGSVSCRRFIQHDYSSIPRRGISNRITLNLKKTSILLQQTKNGYICSAFCAFFEQTLKLNPNN